MQSNIEHVIVITLLLKTTLLNLVSLLVIDAVFSGAVINGQALPTAPPSEKSDPGTVNVLESLASPDGYHGWNKPNTNPILSITVLGATGDLARNKIFPALFALYYSGNLYKVCISGCNSSNAGSVFLFALLVSLLTTQPISNETFPNLRMKIVSNMCPPLNFWVEIF